MSIKQYKPTTPGRRGMTTQDFDGITTKKPVKSLLRIKKSIAGRNTQGRITTRHKGGGVKKFYRLVNFDLRDGLKASVEHIEYDPNRSARIARIKDEDDKLHYILAAKGMKPGKKIASGNDAPISAGNRLPVKNIPNGTVLHCVELIPGAGAQAAKGAGAGAQLVAKESDHAQVRLPSGEVRKVNLECRASIGSVGNEQHQNIKIGKAGRNRKKGIRPTVRGVVMNAVDHPHGGGDGGRHGMGKDPRTPWGQKTLGFKTRRRKSTDKFIVRSRHAGKRR
jgi:large subunit ribosomal protein L2